MPSGADVADQPHRFAAAWLRALALPAYMCATSPALAIWRNRTLLPRSLLLTRSPSRSLHHSLSLARHGRPLPSSTAATPLFVLLYPGSPSSAPPNVATLPQCPFPGVPNADAPPPASALDWSHLCTWPGCVGPSRGRPKAPADVGGLVGAPSPPHSRQRAFDGPTLPCLRVSSAPFTTRDFAPK